MMVKGVGCDIVGNDRFIDAKEGLLRRLFTQNELSEASERANAEEFYGSRFAAKEAFVKALGTGFGLVQPLDVEIYEDALGAPHIRLSEDKEELLRGTSCFLSISHEKEYSMAMVVLDGKE